MDARGLSDVIVAELVAAGADRVFGMPGGGNNLDFIGAAEAAGMDFVLGHQETAVAIMAGVYGDMTNAPGVCVVTRGPGAANAVNGVANASLDRQAMVVVTDAVSSADYERIAHQRIDQRAMFAPVTKASVTVGGLGATSEASAAAVAAAVAAPLGPVHIDFDPAAASTVADVRMVADVDAVQLAAALELVAASARPVVVLGVGVRHLVDEVRALLTGSHVPVLSTYRAKGVVPDSWSSCAGLFTGATMEAPLLHNADLIVMIGVDTVELIPAAWPYAAPVVSFAEWPETSPYLVPAVEVVGQLPVLLASLRGVWPVTQWSAAAGNAHRDSELARMRAAGPDGLALSPQQVVDIVRTVAPVGTTATIDAGAHMFPATTLWAVGDPREMSISSGLATMGFALPAAIGAAYARPEHRVVCFTGDGGLGMCIGELETLARSNLPVTVVVFNDALLSLISIKAKPQGHGGHGAVGFEQVDFAAVARGYGIAAVVATTPGELESAMREAMSVDGPVVVDARVDPAGYKDIMNVVRGAR